jgi:hypothetical protein
VGASAQEHHTLEAPLELPVAKDLMSRDIIELLRPHVAFPQICSAVEAMVMLMIHFGCDVERRSGGWRVRTAETEVYADKGHPERAVLEAAAIHYGIARKETVTQLVSSIHEEC